MPLNSADLQDLDSLFGGAPATVATAPKIDGVDLKDLDTTFGHSDTTPSGLKKVYITGKDDKPKNISTVLANPDIASGLFQGVKDIPASGAQAIGYLDDKIDQGLNKLGITTGGSKRNEDVNKRISDENASLPVDNTAFDVGREVGQIAATAPLMPARAFQAVSGAAKAIPVVGKLAGLVANGGLAGGIFGAATNSTNNEGLASNVGTNAAYGAAAGPVAEAGIQLAGKAVTGAKNIAQSIRTNNILKNSGIDPAAARNTLAKLTDAGYTADQAHAAVQSMGPQATLGDIEPSLTAQVGGLAKMGGKPASIIENRYAERAAGANDVAHNIMETNLGPKPDFATEKQAIHDAANAAVSSDYKLAHKSNQALDVKPIIDSIDTQLNNAVGETKSVLTKVRSYLHDDTGNIKADIAPLHEARQEIDRDLKKLEREGESQSPSYRKLTDVRNKLDAQLKTNPEMASADAKFAEHMDTKNGLDIGYQAMGKNNFNSFKQAFDTASHDKKEAIRLGLISKIGDLMDSASRGEISKAQELFGKSSKNRQMIEYAFSDRGTEVLDALAKQAKFKYTENTAQGGSQTARNQSVQKDPAYGGGPQEGHFLTPVASGAALDLVTGTPGGATAIGAGKGAYEGIKQHFNKEKIKKTIEGTADLLSRQSQHGRDTALDFLSRIEKVRGRNNTKLPVDNSRLIGVTVPATIPTTKRIKSRLSDLVGISQ